MVILMYNLETLTFNYQDLEPFIDTHTNGLHYEYHAKNYLNNLNKILANNNFYKKVKIEEIYNYLSEFKESDKNDLLFYLGGVINHNIYFKTISNFKKEEPNKLLKELINKTYTSIDNFYKEFKDTSLSIKGSGYLFLTITKDKLINLCVTKDQDNPLMYGEIPLLCVDMWEHAYYLNYQNDKGKYLDAFLKLINYNYANKIIDSIYNTL